MQSLTILLPEEGEAWSHLLKRIDDAKGSLLLVAPMEPGVLADNAKRTAVLAALRSRRGVTYVATRDRAFADAARERGLRIVTTVRDLRKLLKGHAQEDDAIRIFSPKLWQQKLRNKLQSMGLLSLPKVRVWILIATSALVFLFVMLRLLPSAEIHVRPRQDTITQTVNIFLVQSGALVDIPVDRVRRLELIPLRVDVSHAMTFDQISKEFIGQSARVAMTVVNKASERYSLRGGTRVTNEAGMIFRLDEAAIVDAGQEVTVRATADDVDLYNEIIGERGNVPANVEWKFPGLAPSEQRLVYAINRTEATGGTTKYRTVLHQEDLEVARLRLEQELLATAKQLIEEKRILENTEIDNRSMQILYYDELTKAEFSNFRLSEQFIGEPVQSVPVEGSLHYTAYAYDSQAVLDMLSDELKDHVEEGKRLLPETLSLSRLVAHVIDYSEDLSWIKLTVDLSGTQEFVLDPLSARGAQFGRTLRELVAGETEENALRVIKNLPEVENAEIRIWPPWSDIIPSIPSHISITPDF